MQLASYPWVKKKIVYKVKKHKWAKIQQSWIVSNCADCMIFLISSNEQKYQITCILFKHVYVFHAGLHVIDIFANFEQFIN